jgi:bifunctional non-homologous end joining protein LigD
MCPRLVHDAELEPDKNSSWPRNRSNPRDKSLREYAAKRDYTRTPEPEALPAAKTRNSKACSGSSSRNIRPVTYIMIGDWKCRVCCVPGRCRKDHRRSCRNALGHACGRSSLEYANFEGTIPPENYGAGIVMVRDGGEYEDLTGNPAAAFHAGKLHLIMRGTKLKGEWILVKDHREEDSNKRLPIKAGESIPPFPKRLTARRW